MNSKSLTWLGLGLCIPVFVLLNTIDEKVGLPSITHNGLFWEQIERKDWIAHKVKLTYDGTVNVGTIEVLSFSTKGFTSDVTAEHTSIEWTSTLRTWIKEVHINGLDIHWNNTLYQTDLEGSVYPLVQLQNDWISIERPKSEAHWTVSGKLNSNALPFDLSLPDMFPQSLDINLNYTVSIAHIDEPVVGTLNNIQLTHPLLGNAIRIPIMSLTMQRKTDTWTGGVSNENSTFDWMWVDLDQQTPRGQDIGKIVPWALNYNISLSDLADWFQIHVPISKPTGHWYGTITPTQATISSMSLGFEGKVYALNRLQAGQPITYQPIHAEYTKLIGPNTPSWVPYPQLGWLAKAVIAGEDAPFYTHDGFNEEGLNRALNELLMDKENPIGGSSITQQVAKNLFTGNQTTLDRKVEEMVYTLGLETTLSKEAILALYLNSIEFGDGIYGVRDAAEKYFLKAPKYLSLKEAVFLASILPNPRDGYRRAKLGRPPTGRMKAILQNLVDGNQISTFIMNETLKEPLRLLLPVD